MRKIWKWNLWRYGRYYQVLFFKLLEKIQDWINAWFKPLSISSLPRKSFSNLAIRISWSNFGAWTCLACLFTSIYEQGTAFLHTYAVKPQWWHSSEFFLEAICTSERQLLEQAFQCLLLGETMRLKNLFSQYDPMGIPNPFSLKYFGTIQKLFYVVENIKVTSDFNQISEENFLVHIQLIKPAGKKVAEKFYGDSSEDANLARHEEWIFDYVKNTLRRLGLVKKKLSNFWSMWLVKKSRQAI